VEAAKKEAATATKEEAADAAAATEAAAEGEAERQRRRERRRRGQSDCGWARRLREVRTRGGREGNADSEGRAPRLEGVAEERPPPNLQAAWRSARRRSSAGRKSRRTRREAGAGDARRTAPAAPAGLRVLRAGGRRWSRRRGVRVAGRRRVSAAGRLRKALAAFMSVILPSWRATAGGWVDGGGDAAPDGAEPAMAKTETGERNYMLLSLTDSATKPKPPQ